MSLEKYQQKKKAQDDNFSDAGEVALGVAGMHPMTGQLAASPFAMSAVGGKNRLQEVVANTGKRGFSDAGPQTQQRLKNYMDNFPSLKAYAEKNKINLGYNTSPAAYDFELGPQGQKTVRFNGRGLPLIMHEMGHAMTTDSNPVSKLRHNLASKIQGAHPRMSTLGKVGAGWGWNLADSVMAPIDEAVAWKKAFGIADEVGAPSALKKKMMKMAIPAYGSYIARSIPTLGGAALAAHGIYDALTED